MPSEMDLYMTDYDVTQHDEYSAKILIDTAQPVHSFPSHKKPRENAWCRNRAHKKAMVRRFLSRNPSMNLSDKGGTQASPGIYVVTYYDEEPGSHHKPNLSYNLNPCEYLFLSFRGDIRKYHGRIVYSRRGSYCLMNKEYEIPTLTNRRIRRLPIKEDDRTLCPSYYKKLLSPQKDPGW